MHRGAGRPYDLNGLAGVAVGPDILHDDLPPEMAGRTGRSGNSGGVPAIRRCTSFSGSDNVYFYGPAEMAMFMGQQGEDPVVDPPEGELQLPELIVNNHPLSPRQKASSSVAIGRPWRGTC